jgi:hypothetical protein
MIEGSGIGEMLTVSEVKLAVSKCALHLVLLQI